MESRAYKFNESTLTVRFGNIIETRAEVIVSSDDCYVTMDGGHAGVSGAIYQAGSESIMRDAQKMVPSTTWRCDCHNGRQYEASEVRVPLHYNRQEAKHGHYVKQGYRR